MDRIGASGLATSSSALATEARFVTGSAESGQLVEEVKENGFQEVPIFGAGGEEGTEPEFGAFDFVDVDGGEIPLAGSGDVETETERAVGSV